MLGSLLTKLVEQAIIGAQHAAMTTVEGAAGICSKQQDNAINSLFQPPSLGMGR